MPSAKRQGCFAGYWPPPLPLFLGDFLSDDNTMLLIVRGLGRNWSAFLPDVVLAVSSSSAFFDEERREGFLQR